MNLREWTDAARREGGVSRRMFLAFTAALTASTRWAHYAEASGKAPSFSSDPFTLGVASGDPDESSVVLWTRLAPKPLDPDGGMPPENVAVQWTIADDVGMKQIVANGFSTARADFAHSVHVVVEGLKPDRWYWYRFTVGDAVSSVGRTRTMPTRDSSPSKLRFAFASCQHYEQGLFTAYQQMAKDELDLVVHLGDYIYEYPGVANRVRLHAGPKDSKLLSLTDYRNRHSQYRSDKLLQAMHAQCPWFVTWDDHEFDNNYANDLSEMNKNPQTRVEPAKFLEQRAAAYQAYYEAMPLRPQSMPKGPDLQLFRKASFGRLAEFSILDTRQYRTDQPNGDGLRPLNQNALDPKNSLLGANQKNWLKAGLRSSKAKWNVLAQQVMMAMVEFRSPMRTGYSMDQWPGAAAERMELVQFLAEQRIANPIVLTGDIHSNWVNELRADDRKAENPIVATEFVGTSISSGGTGFKNARDLEALQSTNPCVRYHDRLRGYVRCEVTPERWTSDYIAVLDVRKPDGEIRKSASFVVEDGRPGIQKA